MATPDGPNTPPPSTGGALLSILRTIGGLLGTVILIGLAVFARVAGKQAGPSVGLAIAGALFFLVALVWFVTIGAKLLVQDSHRPRPSKLLAVMKVLVGLPLAYFALFGIGPTAPYGLLPGGEAGIEWSLAYAAPLAIGCHLLLMGTCGLIGMRPPFAARFVIFLAILGGLSYLGPKLSADYLSAAKAEGTIPVAEFRFDSYDLDPVVCKFTNAGQMLIVCGDELDVEAFDLKKATRDWKQTKNRATGSWVTVVAFDERCESYAWSVGTDRDVKVAAVKTGEYRTTAKVEGREYVSSLAFDADGKRLIAAVGTEVVVLAADTLKELKRLTGDEKQVRGVCFVPDGKQAVSCGYDGTARLWDIEAGTSQTLFTTSAQCEHVMVSTDGRFAAIAGKDGVRICDLKTAKVTQHLKQEQPETFRVAFDPKGQWVAATRGGSFSEDQLTVWNVSTGQLLYEHSFHYAIQSLAFHPQEKQLALGGDDRLRLWNLSTHLK